MILLLHNRYRVPGGEERAVEDLAWLIRTELGEEAEVLERDSARMAPRDAARGLLSGGPVAGPVTRSLLWAAGFLLVFAPLSVRAFRRRI